MIYPVLFMVLGAFTTNERFTKTLFLPIPNTLNIEAFKRILNAGDLGRIFNYSAPGDLLPGGHPAGRPHWRLHLFENALSREKQGFLDILSRDGHAGDLDDRAPILVYGLVSLGWRE